MENENFDPSSPLNLAAAHTAAAINGAQARSAESDTLPFPPNNLPPLKSIQGAGFDKAIVLGYVVATAEVRDCIAPDGSIKYPGDKDYLDAQMGRLGVHQMPKGWVFESRQAFKLFALVEGNPILLENQAKEIGYFRAVASAPKWLDLGEIK